MSAPSVAHSEATKRHIVFRRLKSDVLRQLPPKRRHVRRVAIAPEMQRDIRAGFRQRNELDLAMKSAVSNLWVSPPRALTAWR